MKLFLLAIILLFSLVHSQVERVVSPDGVDEFDCVPPNSPCATIGYAYLSSFNDGDDGDTIRLMPGTYGPGTDSIFVSTRPLILFADFLGAVTIELTGNFRWLVPVGNTNGLNTVSNIIFSGANNNDVSFFDGNRQDWDFENIIWRDANSPEVRQLIVLDGGTTNFRNCSWENILIPTNNGGRSTIIFIDDADQETTFDDCIFRNNRALDSPVHIRAASTSGDGWVTTFNRCQIFQNIGDATSGFLRVQDDAISPNDPIVTFNDCVIDSNSGTDAGAIFAAVGDLFLRNTTITNCIAFNAGGALDLNRNFRILDVQGGLFANNDIVGLGSAACMLLSGAAVDPTSDPQNDPQNSYTINGTTFVNHFLEPIPAGGGVFSTQAGVIWIEEGAAAQIIDSSFQLNSVGITGRAGAILVDGPGVNISDCIFTNTNGNGALVINNGASNIQRTPFSSFPVDLVISGGSLVVDDDTNIQGFDKETVSISSGRLTLGSGLTSVTLDNLQMDGGVLELLTDLVITTSLTWTAGEIMGPGSLTLGPNCITDIIGSGNSQRITRAPTTNNGIMRFSGVGECLQTNNFTNTNTLVGSACSLSVGPNSMFALANSAVLRSRGLMIDIDASSSISFGANSITYIQLTASDAFNGLTIMSPSMVTLGGNLRVEAALPFGPSNGGTYNGIVTAQGGGTFSGGFNPPNAGVVGTLVSNPTTIDLTITSVILTLNDDIIRGFEDQPVTFNPFENDIIPRGEIPSQGVSDEGDATVEFSGNFLTFTPPENENGDFTFRYSVGGASATVTVQLLPVNDRPEVSPVENVNVRSDPGSFTFPGEDIDNSEEQIQVFLLSLPANGGSIIVDGEVVTSVPREVPRTVQFRPMDGSDDSVSYILTDGIILTDSVALSINFDDSTDNTAVTVGIVLGAVIGFCCCLVIVLSVLLGIWRAKKPPKTALVKLLLEPDLAVVSAIQETQPAETQKQLALYFTQVFCYNKATQALVAHYIAQEVARVKNESLLFRENTFASKLLKTYADIIGQHFLRRALSDVVKEVLDEDTTFEVNPVHEVDPSQIQKNQEQLKSWCSGVLEAIFKNRQHLPIECKQVCAELYRQSEAKWKGTGDKAVGAFLFLRWISPALISPEGWGLSSSTPDKQAMRNLLLIVKPIQNLANGLKFGSKEEYMVFMNEWIEENQEPFNEFISFARNDSEGESSPDITKSNYKSSVNEIHKLIFDSLTQVTDRLDKSDADRLNKIMVLLGAPDDSDVNVELQMLAEHQVRESTMVPSSTGSIIMDSPPSQPQSDVE